LVDDLEAHGRRLAALFPVSDNLLFSRTFPVSRVRKFGAAVTAVEPQASPPSTLKVAQTLAAAAVDRSRASGHACSTTLSGISMNAAVPPHPVTAAGSARFGNHLPLAVIAGPCVLESRDHALDVAGALKEIAGRLGIGLVYKTSFDKANRTSAVSARGVGLDGALAVFEEIRSKLGLPVLTDVHESGQCPEVAAVVDVLQIPAFLCRQTDLLVAAARTGRVINVKKGQFLAPWDMTHVVAKITGAGNRNVMVTERGASFGYNTLVSDMRALPVLARTGAPVIFDATHSVQQPGGQGASSGGQREFVSVLARAAVAVGVAGVFIETHQDPDHAPSDGPNMVPLNALEGLLRELIAFDRLAKEIASADSKVTRFSAKVVD
jgi:2-dehydro-3-deoxyphosphooctonate aldolase (KDO 8-P synthase)